MKLVTKGHVRDTSGPLRIERRSKGVAVIGEGWYIYLRSRRLAKVILKKLTHEISALEDDIGVSMSERSE